MESTFNIQNLKCCGCANTIITRLSALQGISEVTVSNEQHSVSFNHNSNSQLNLVEELLSKLGYPVKGKVNSIGKKAKSFVSCAIGRINK